MKAKTTITILLILVLFNCNSITAQVLEQDSLALVAFYNSTGGPNWNNNSGWLTGPVNTWYGVTVEGNRVTGLIINSNNLSGTLPNDLGQLTALESLGMSNDHELTGFLPVSLFQITTLKWFGIGNCSLTGTIPNIIGDCSLLLSIELWGNNLTGPIPQGIGNLDSLMFLDLHDNLLTGSIPLELGNCNDLKVIELNDNQLTGTIPPELAQLNNLIGLSLQNNQLTGNIPGNFSNFFTSSTPPIGLNVSNNNLGDSLPESWANMDFLIEIFDISNNNFTYLPSVNYNWIMTFFRIESNNFSFEHIESHKQAYNAGLYFFFYYSPQSYMEDEIDTALSPGSNYSIYSGTGGEFTNYHWFLNDQLIIESPDADTLYLNNIGYADTGIYSCYATNTLVNWLNLYRRPVHITIDTSVYVTDPEIFDINLECFPNPAFENITVTITADDEIIMANIFNISGQCVRSEQQIPVHDYMTKINLDGIPYGIYFIQIITSEAEYYCKFFKGNLGADR